MDTIDGTRTQEARSAGVTAERAAEPGRHLAASAPLGRGVTEVAELQAALRERFQAGRAEIRTAFEATNDGERVHADLAQLMDELIRAAADWGERRFGSANPTTGEQLAIIAVGGYGRGELAPESDIDLLFLHPYKRSPFVEQMTEFVLLRLFDLRLTVGNAVRSISDCVRLARQDLTVQTALLDTRSVWGDRALFDELESSFAKQVVNGHGAEFIEAKLAERDARHRKLGDSRYLLEPNIKEGKGGLRDLHTLMWIGRFLYGVRQPAELVQHAVLDRTALATFLRSRRFLWAVRCHMHWLTGRADERLTFHLQVEIARRMDYRARHGMRSVERFMKRYYLAVKDVGALTRIVCAALEDQNRRRPRFSLPRLGFGRKTLNGFTIQGSRVGLAEADLFQRRPEAMLELFHLAQQRELDIHPKALTAIGRNLWRINGAVRESPTANRLFLEMLTSPKDPALTLNRMNEAGVLRRFVPDFGRVFALLQQNFYHVYTVDEHTIQAISALHQIEQGKLAQDLPVSTEIMPKLRSRTELYVAVFLHDIGKGRGGNHSIIGEQIALTLCPRFGLSEAATETVAWLVRNHLVMSSFAFKRDTEDAKTIQDFVEMVQSPERLKLLLVLTAADIRAVGPNVWNGWKGQLLRELYHEASTAMASGDAQGRRATRVERAKRELAQALAEDPGRPWPPEAIEDYLARHDARYWLSFPPAEHLRHALVIAAADQSKAQLAAAPAEADSERVAPTVDFWVDRFRARSEVLIYTPDHPGLFMEICGALALSNVSIADARIFTTQNGMALDVLRFQDATQRSAVEDRDRLALIKANIESAVGNRRWLEEALAKRRYGPDRTAVFQVEPRVLVDNRGSRTLSVIEVNGRDRPGLLYELARALMELGLVIQSAHISTYGARVVDVFYVKDVFGIKITNPNKITRIEKRLGKVLHGDEVISA